MTTTQQSAPPPPPGGERRRSPRRTLLAQVELRRASEVVVLPVGNVSATGIFLGLERLDLPRRVFRPGEVVNVFLAVEDAGEELVVSMDAEVMRVEAGGAGRPPGVGLRWVTTDPAMVDTLARILERVAIAVP